MWILIANFILHQVLALLLPVSNDEAYYWEWGQALQLSFLDHPPGVAWQTALSSLVANGKWSVRFVSPFLHTFLLWLNFRILRESGVPSELLEKRRLTMWVVLCPGLFLMGSLALPDLGLLCFLQLALWQGLRLLKKASLSPLNGFVWGAMLASAALFKYHALPMGLCMVLGFLFMRGGLKRSELSFYVAAVVAAVMVLFPVWWWNSQNQWVSFRFQVAHGFDSGQFSWKGPLLAVLGCSLVVGPVLFFTSLKGFFSRRHIQREPLSLLTLPAVWTLLVILVIAAMRKPILPHWVLPAYSLALPWMFSHLAMSRRLEKLQLAYAVIALLVIVLLMNPWTMKHVLLPNLAGDPGPLTELSLWEEAAPVVDSELTSWESRLSQKEMCGEHLRLASFRWWQAAQLHFHMPQRPPVMGLQPQEGSFYRTRDEELKHAPCLMAVFIDERQRESILNLGKLDIVEERRLSVPYHEKQNWILLLTRLNAPL